MTKFSVGHEKLQHRTIKQEIQEDVNAAKTQLKTFGETTTVKGLPKLMKAQAPCLRVMWLVAIVAGLGLSLFQCSTLAKDFFAYEVVTKMQFCSDCRAPFPDITICNINPLNSLKEFHEAGYMRSYVEHMDYVEEVSTAALTYGYNMTYDELLEVYHEGFSLAGYFQNLNVTVTSLLMTGQAGTPIIIDCKWYAWNGKKYLYEQCIKQSIYTFYSPGYFVCNTIHMNDTNLDSSNTDVSSFLATLYLNDFAEIVMRTMSKNIYASQAKGLRVLVHPPNTVPDMSKGFNIPAGHEVQIRLEPKQLIRLGEPYGKCSNAEYLNDKEEEKGDQYQVPFKYSAEACKSLCYQQASLDECNCFNPHLPLSHKLEIEHPDAPWCGHLKNDSVIGIYDVILRIKCYLFQSENEGDSYRHCECLLPCQEFVYDYQLLQSPWPHESYMLQFYDRYLRRDPFATYFNPTYGPLAAQLQDNNTAAAALQQLKQLNMVERNFIQLKVLFQHVGHNVFTDIPSMTFDAFVGNAGGILNLWIGITFFTFVELFDLIYNVIVAECNVDRKAKKKDTDEPMKDIEESIKVNAVFNQPKDKWFKFSSSENLLDNKKWIY